MTVIYNRNRRIEWIKVKNFSQQIKGSEFKDFFLYLLYSMDPQIYQMNKKYPYEFL